MYFYIPSCPPKSIYLEMQLMALQIQSENKTVFR